MPSDRSRKLRQSTLLKAAERSTELSPHHALENSFKIIESLRPTKETMPVATDFFYNVFLLVYGKDKARVLKKEDKELQFLCLVSSLWFSSSTQPLRVSLNTNYYIGDKNTSLSGFMIKLIHWLHDKEYIYLLPGIHLPNKDLCKWTRIWPLKKLNTELLHKLEVCSDPSFIKTDTLIILRNKQKDPVPYEDDELPLLLRSSLQKINLCNSQHRVTLPHKNKDKIIITDLHMVFNNGSFTEGGRFYTGRFGYSNLSKKDRPNLLIDGNATVELDFSALHPRLLYAMKGIQYNEDPYTAVIDNVELRDILKKVLLALFNTESYSDAVRAGNYNVFIKIPPKLKKDHQFVRSYLSRSKKMKLRRTLLDTGYTIKQLVEMFTKEHEDISDYFCTKQGYSLMNIDSQIARRVLEHFTEMGEACLCIHDSFIVEERLEQELRKTMDFSYGEITQQNISPDHKRYQCKIDKK